MPLNFFSFSNVSHLPSSRLSSNVTQLLSIDTCLQSSKNVFIFTSFSVTSFLLLPLFILVLYVGHQRWRKQSSVTATATMSHSDFLTYNMIAMEMISIAGNCFCCNGTFSGIQSVMVAGLYMFSISSPGQILLHILTCVERYLAVVHPIIYLGLKQSDGIKTRNIITLISVICVLIRPRPGDGSGDRERVDHLKQRAVNTIMQSGVTFAVSAQGKKNTTLMPS
ncbi:hypothetical protein Q8A73_012590 [Channa argus]|nr:hypothetical protein Q8A73_012590 [Channa argus]